MFSIRFPWPRRYLRLGQPCDLFAPWRRRGRTRRQRTSARAWPPDHSLERPYPIVSGRGTPRRDCRRSSHRSVELQRLIVVLDGADRASALALDRRRRGRRRPPHHLDRAGPPGGNLAMAASMVQLLAREAAIVDGGRIIWLEPDRLIEVLNGGVPLLLSAVGYAAIVEGRCVMRVDLYCPVIVLNGPIPLSLRAVGGAAIGKCNGQAASSSIARFRS